MTACKYIEGEEVVFNFNRITQIVRGAIDLRVIRVTYARCFRNARARVIVIVNDIGAIGHGHLRELILRVVRHHAIRIGEHVAVIVISKDRRTNARNGVRFGGIVFVRVGKL